MNIYTSLFIRLPNLERTNEALTTDTENGFENLTQLFHNIALLKFPDYVTALPSGFCLTLLRNSWHIYLKVNDTVH